MKIGIDLRPLQGDHKYRGIGVHLRSLLKNLPSGHTYIFYILENMPNPLANIELPDIEHETVRLVNRYGHIHFYNLKNLWHNGLVLSKQDLDVFLETDAAFGIPRGDVPIALMAYDLIPLIFETDNFPPLLKMFGRYSLKTITGSAIRRIIYPRQLRQYHKADRIIAISESTKKDLINYLDVDRPISMAHLGVDKPKDNLPSIKELGVTTPYIFYIGGADYRKNVGALISAFREVKKDGLRLVLAGRDFAPGKNLVNPELESMLKIDDPDIQRVGYISKDQAQALFGHAELFVFPSLYEGFGLPVLEAMACGCPVIAYKNSSVPEIAGDAALLINGDNELSGAINKLIADEKLREKMKAAGLKQADRFSWLETASNTIRALGETAK